MLALVENSKSLKESTMMTSSEIAPLKLGIVGCGAAAEQGHIPAAVVSDKVELAVLVDTNIARANKLADRFSVPRVAEDYKEIFGQADAAIVALPHALHAPISIDFLNRGIHVLVEKPMAPSTAECDRMITAARQSGATLAVGLVRRFRYIDQFIKALFDSGFLGKIESFDLREGNIYNWPIASDFYFRKEMACGGVLMDTGAHALDTLLWWFGDYESFDYFDDNMGGIEADCQIHLKMKNSVRGFVDLSRIRNLRNTIIIKSEKATVEVHVHRFQISIQPKGLHKKIVGDVVESYGAEWKARSVKDLFTAQLEDWVEAIQNGGQPLVPGEEARKSVELIEACYQNRKLLELPWQRCKTV